ncbi:MAG TPA: histidine triad nucleotide-binding protein [Acidimicrobiales bacterium]|nr:histidine triad nucleotide-binding protein [Acidimicrobiales bacterium]
MGDCLFCRVVAGDVPSDEVASSEATFAFRDINPTAPTHVLVIPRKHIDNAHDLGAEHADLLVDMLATAQRVAEQEGIAEGGYRLVFNIGRDAGNTVPHLHLHVLGGRALGWPPG